MSTDIRYENGKLHVTRTYAAPREAVFDAWVETSKIEKWWGCSQTTAVKSEIEPKVGGKFNHLMTIDGAGQYPSMSCFAEYDPPARLVYVSEATEMAPSMTVSVDFVECDEGTEVRLVHEGLPEQFLPYVKDGWGAALGKLDAFLAAGV